MINPDFRSEKRFMTFLAEPEGKALKYDIYYPLQNIFGHQDIYLFTRIFRV